MSRKEILFLTSWYPSKENPSLGNFVVKHAQCAAEVANITVLYATSSDSVHGIQVEDDIEDGVRTIRVFYPKKEIKIPLLSSYAQYQTYLKALKRGYDRIERDIDLVHLNVAFPAGLFALELYRKKVIPYILLEHWTGYLSHKNTYNQQPFYIRRLHRKIFTHAQKVLPVSEHLGESLKALHLVEEYLVYPNVVDGKLFHPSKEKKSSDQLRILHISSFDDDHKNVSGMLEGITQLKRSFHLHLITEGEVDQVEYLISKAGIDRDQVIIESQCTSEEIVEAFRENDVFVLFSNYETFSVVLAESWMSGIPAIYSRCGGLTEINNPKLGVQIEKNSINQLSEALESFLPSKYDTKSICSFAQQFEKIQLSDEIRKIYDELG